MIALALGSSTLWLLLWLSRALNFQPPRFQAILLILHYWPDYRLRARTSTFYTHHTQTHTHTLTHTPKHTCTCTPAHAHTCTPTHAHTCTCSHTLGKSECVQTYAWGKHKIKLMVNLMQLRNKTQGKNKTKLTVKVAYVILQAICNFFWSNCDYEIL